MNGVGEYNLVYPLKEIKQIGRPFLSSSLRVEKKIDNSNIGPGSYNKYDTFFEWNKKSYNIKIKDEVDKFKSLKN